MYSKPVNLLIKDERTGKDVRLKIHPGVPFAVVYRGAVRAGVTIDKKKLKKLIELATTGGSLH